MDGFILDTQKMVGLSHAFVIADELWDLNARSMSIRQTAIDLEGCVDSVNMAKCTSRTNTFCFALKNAAHLLKWHCIAQTQTRYSWIVEG